MNELLQIEHLSSGYNGRTVLRDPSFSVSRGEILGIIGQNGCGKSTLLKTIARIITENTGKIYFEGLNLQTKNTWELKQLGISWFVQGGMVFSTMRVSEHFQLALREKSKTLAGLIRDECLSYFPALAGCLDKRGGNLSGGQRQMLSFAMLLSQQTKCWLLDEPTAGLSPEAVNDAFSFLKRMKEDAGKAMILVEHNYGVAFGLADRIGVIAEGNWQRDFSKAEFQNENFLDLYLYNQIG